MTTHVLQLASHVIEGERNTRVDLLGPFANVDTNGTVGRCREFDLAVLGEEGEWRILDLLHCEYHGSLASAATAEHHDLDVRRRSVVALENVVYDPA